jgi:hypothetical protein
MCIPPFVYTHCQQLNHYLHAVAERYDMVVNFADIGLPPVVNNNPWAHVYVVNDFGQNPSSLAPPLFCKVR